jgi:hypothetical protein
MAECGDTFLGGVEIHGGDPESSDKENVKSLVVPAV